MLLYGKLAIEKKKPILANFFSNKPGSYIAILFFGNNAGSQVYVKNKQKFGDSIGCGVYIFGQEKDYTYSDIIQLIHHLNNDIHCIGILIQLPLPDWLQPYQKILCDEISVDKDIDAMTTSMMGRIAIGSKYVVYPAAVAATIEILKYYDLHNQKGKQIAILGQSNLIGKPMALYCINQGAQVHSFGVDGDPKVMRELCRKSDYIISATGVVGLVDKKFVSEGQIVIDIGYGFTKEGKATGDVQFDEVEPLVQGITPVPGGIGPMCVCELFANVMELYSK